MRVLHVISTVAPRSGGTATYVLGLAEALAGRGIDTTIFASDLGGAESARPVSRIRAEDLGATGFDVRLFPARQPHRFAYTPDLPRALSAAVGDFDCVHVHNLWTYPQWAGARAARRGGVPYVVAIHGALDAYIRTHGRVHKAVAWRLWQARMLARASGLQATTERELRAIADVAPHVRRFVAPPGIHPAQTAPGDGRRFRRDHLDDVEGPLVLFVGRIAYKKGLELLIEALPILSERHPDVNVAVVGPDDEGLQATLTVLGERLGVGSRVHFTGPLYGGDLRDALAAADVWTLPSRAENFGIAVVEALRAGVPVVVSEGVDVGHDMAQAGAGLVTAIEPKALADGLHRVLGDAALTARLRHAGPAFAERYRWSSVIDQHLAMYHALAAG